MNKPIIWIPTVLILLAAGVWFLLRGDDAANTQPLAEKITGTHYVGDGRHVVEGMVVLPNPCYDLSTAAEIRASRAEALLRFTAEQTADTCVQVLYEAPFRVSFAAGESIELFAEINGVPVLLELERKERISADTGSEFIIAIGEDRWVEDLQIVFDGIVDDSRCPQGVTCIQAGWVTVRLQAGGEEFTLRMPGDQTIPNAMVAGSYIITLVDIKPVPMEGDTVADRDYRATLRVEAHDLKG